MFHRRHKFNHRFLVTSELSIARLFIAIGVIAVETVWALYLYSFGLSEATIGFISSLLVLVMILASLYSTPLLEAIREYRLLMISVLGMIIFYLLVFFIRSLWFFLFASVMLSILTIFRANSFDILFRDESDDAHLNQDEGLMWTLSNIGFMLGPLIAGFVMTLYDIPTVFIAASLSLSFVVFFLFMIKIRQPRKKRQEANTQILENLKRFFAKKSLRLPYLMTFGMEIWWALIYIYIPLFIVKEGLGPEFVGLFLSIVAIPLILFEYMAGKISMKFGFRPFFIFGYATLAICALAAYLSSSLEFALFFLFLGSFGMAFIEPLGDAYFFKQVSSLDEEPFFPIFASAFDIGSFVGKFVIAGFLLFFAYEVAYLVIAVMMGLLALGALRIKSSA